jgi:hypothetical protein
MILLFGGVGLHAETLTSRTKIVCRQRVADGYRRFMRQRVGQSVTRLRFGAAARTSQWIGNHQFSQRERAGCDRMTQFDGPADSKRRGPAVAKTASVENPHPSRAYFKSAIAARRSAISWRIRSISGSGLPAVSGRNAAITMERVNSDRLRAPAKLQANCKLRYSSSLSQNNTIRLRELAGIRFLKQSSKISFQTVNQYSNRIEEWANIPPESNKRAPACARARP